MRHTFFLLAALLLVGCKNKDQTAAHTRIAEDGRVLPEAPLGVVEVLNGSGIKGAANLVARRLQDKGYDVVKVGNAPEKNYLKTLVAVRRPGTAVGERVAAALGVTRLLPYYNENLLVDASVFVGQDYQEILKP